MNKKNEYSKEEQNLYSREDCKYSKTVSVFQSEEPFEHISKKRPATREEQSTLIKNHENEPYEDRRYIDREKKAKKFIAIQLAILIILSILVVASIFLKVQFNTQTATVYIITAISFFVSAILMFNILFIRKTFGKTKSNKKLEETEIEHNPDIIYDIGGNKYEETLALYNDEIEDEEKVAYIIDRTNGKKTEINNKTRELSIGSLEGRVDHIIRSRMVSREHAKIIIHQGEHYIVDLGSKNGTYINGSRINSNKRYKLEPGDGLRFADVEYYFYIY